MSHWLISFLFFLMTIPLSFLHHGFPSDKREGGNQNVLFNLFKLDWDLQIIYFKSWKASKIIFLSLGVLLNFLVRNIISVH